MPYFPQREKDKMMIFNHSGAAGQQRCESEAQQIFKNLVTHWSKSFGCLTCDCPSLQPYVHTSLYLENIRQEHFYLGTVYMCIFDIGHPCNVTCMTDSWQSFEQHHMTILQAQIESSFRPWGHPLFGSWLQTRYCFSIELQALTRLIL